MKHIYILNFHYDNGEIVKAWSGEAWATMKGACRNGENKTAYARKCTLID